MRPIPLNLLTLYEDLVQNVEVSDVPPATVSTRTVRGRLRLYATERVGAMYRQRYIGLAEDPAAQERAEAIRQSAQSSKLRRSTVSLLKQARIPAPSLPVGRILESVAKAGLFKQGLVLVGTIAYQTYPCVVGSYLPSSQTKTQDADFAVAKFAVPRLAQGDDMEVILKRADSSFRPDWKSADNNLPRRFVSSALNFEVDLLTTAARATTSLVPIPGLKCAAVPLKFLDYLIESTTDAVALYGSGVPVRIPTPARYAVHKLIVASERSQVGKQKKDLAQARELIDILLETDQGALEDALEDARNRGRSWSTAVNASLREIGRQARQGRLPLPVD